MNGRLPTVSWAPLRELPPHPTQAASQETMKGPLHIPPASSRGSLVNSCRISEATPCKAPGK